MAKPRSLKIVSWKDDRLQSENLEILRDELKQYGNTPIALISVAGRMRGGKSYLLNRLIENMEKGKPFEGFKFQADTERCTTGIDVWTKPYKVDGKDLVVLFMDTQGVFDHNENIAGEADLVALSILLSSVQVALCLSVSLSLTLFLVFTSKFSIFNAKGFVDANDKNYLEVYTQLAQNAQQARTGGKFQGRIKPSSDLNDSFEEIECHLLPQPGTQFEEQDKNFDHDNQFIEFYKRIAKFATTVLDPDGLEPKKFNGKPVTCFELVNFLERLIVWFNTDKTVRVKTPQQAMAEARIYYCLKRSKASYDERMKNEAGIISDKAKLLRNHEEAKDFALSMYEKCSARCATKLFKNSKAELLSYIQGKLDIFSVPLIEKQGNIDRAAKDEAYSDFLSSMTAKMENDRTLFEFHTSYQELRERACDSYRNRQIIYDDAGSGFDKELQEKMMRDYEFMMPTVLKREIQDKEAEMFEVLQLAKNEYDRMIEQDGMDLADRHGRALESALALFRRSPTEPRQVYDRYRAELETYIQRRYEEFRLRPPVWKKYVMAAITFGTGLVIRKFFFKSLKFVKSCL